MHRHRTVALPICRLLAAAALGALLALPSPSLAALRVSQRGPRAGTVAVRFRQAFAAAKVRSGRLGIHVRRGRPAWIVTVRYTPPGGRPVVQVIRARHGRVSYAQALTIARRAAAALRGGGRPRPGKPNKPEKPDKPEPDEPDQPAAPPAPTPRPAQPPPAAPQPAPAPQPSPPPASPGGGDDDLGFEVGKQAPKRPDDIPVYRPHAERAERAEIERAEVRKRPSARAGRMPRDRAVARLGAGVGMAWRRFLLDAQTAAMNYESGLFSQLSIEGELFPLQLLTASAIARLGVRLSYAQSAGLSTELEDSEADSLSTSIARIWAGLVYLLPRFRDARLPRFDLRAGIAHTGFSVDDNPAATVQDLSLTAFAAGATITVMFKRYLGVELGAEYRVLLRVRSDFMAPYETRPGGLQGFNVTGGLRGRVVGGLGYRATMGAERFVGDLPALDTGAVLKVRDWTVCADLALTYEM